MRPSIVQSLLTFGLAPALPGLLSASLLSTHSAPVASQAMNLAGGQHGITRTSDQTHDNTEMHPLVASMTPLEQLPAGQYYYQDVVPKSGYLVLRKIGHTVVGIDRRAGSQDSCFRGVLEDDRILNATRIFPPYRPDSRTDHQAELIDVSHYQRIDRSPSAADAAALHTCIVFFQR